MKRYRKTIILSFLLLLSIPVFIGKVAETEWMRHKIVSALTTSIAENTPLKSSVVSYEKVKWGGIFHPFSVSVSGVRVTDETGQTIKSEKIYAGWSLSSLLALNSIPSVFKFESAAIVQKETLVLTADFMLRNDKRDKRLIVSRLTIDPVALSDLDFFPDTFKTVLKKLNLPLELQGDIDWDQQTLKRIDLTAVINNGSFSYDPFFPKTVALAGLKLNLNSITSKEIKGSLVGTMDDIPLEVEVFLKCDQPFLATQEKEINLGIQAKAKDVPIDNLYYLWPVGLAPKPRHWVTTNLSKGKAKEATLKADLSLFLGKEATFQQLEIHKIEGDIYPEGVDVSYLGKLPKVLNTSGHAYYTKSQFFIEAVGVVNEMDLTKGYIVINALDQEDQDIEIYLDIEGNIARAFDIISAPPLELTQKLGLNLKQAGGKSINHVELKFPLKTDIELEEINVESISKISQGKAVLLDIIEGEEINVAQGEFDLKVNKSQLVLNGKAGLNGLISDITWNECFEKENVPFLRKLILKGGKEVLWGGKESPFLKGYVPVEFIYQKFPNHKTAANIHVSLSSLLMNLPWASYYKNSDVPAQLTLVTEGGDGEETIVKEGKLAGNNLTATIQGTWGKPTSVLSVTNLKMGDIQGYLKISKKNNRYDVQGTLNEIDVFSFLNQSLPDAEGDASSFSADIAMIVKKVIISDTYNLSNLMCKVQFAGGNLQTVEIDDNKKHFNFIMTPRKDETQHFILSSQNGAELLEVFTPGSDFSDGKINIVGTRKLIGKDSQVQAELDVRDLVVHQAPLLAKILSLTSVNGIMSFLSGDGLKFDYGRAEIFYQKDKLEIKDAFLTGSSLGLTFGGTVKEGDLHFMGEVIPFYGLNNILSKIPVIGGILSGNSDHAIFSTPFELKGSRDKPDIQVNALTTLAPGGVRKMFGADGGE